MFRSFLIFTLCASILCLSSLPAASSHEKDYHLGEWIGTWHSSDTFGHFDLDLERAPDGKVAGNIVVSTDRDETSAFAVDLRHVSFEGDTFTAVFVTPGGSPEVIKLTGTLSAQSGYGLWFAHQQLAEPETGAAAAEPATGTWQLEKHESK